MYVQNIKKGDKIFTNKLTTPVKGTYNAGLHIYSLDINRLPFQITISGLSETHG